MAVLRKARIHALWTYRIFMVICILAVAFMAGVLVRVYAAEEPEPVVHASACVDTCQTQGGVRTITYWKNGHSDCECNLNPLRVAEVPKPKKFYRNPQDIRRELAR